jgi:hypothetical protein
MLHHIINIYHACMFIVREILDTWQDFVTFAPRKREKIKRVNYMLFEGKNEKIQNSFVVFCLILCHLNT